jgi:hypothetical protein
MGWGPKAPDMTASNIAAQSAASSAATGTAIAQDQWDYYKTNIAPRALEQMDAQIDISRDSYELAKAQQEFQMGLTQQYNDRYWNTQIPLEDSMIADAMKFDSGEWAAEKMGLARSDIAQTFDTAEATQQRNMSRRGVNPNDGMALALGGASARTKALAETQARSQINLAADQLGWARKGEVAALGRGLPGFTSGASSAALGWNGAGLNSAASGMAGITAAGGLGTSAASSAANSMFSGASAYNGVSSNLRANSIESAKNPGFDAAMGLVAGGMKLAGSIYG